MGGKGKRKGGKGSGGPGNEAFETMKQVVRAHLGKKGPSGATAGCLGYELNANRKVINAVLYACQQESTAWATNGFQSGEKVRWACEPCACEEPVPAQFSYVEKPEGAKGKGKTSSADHNADFETMKLVCRAAIAAKEDKGASSGMLGHELGSSRKSVTAALYSCLEDGTVQNTAPEGTKPRWISVEPPPAHAASLSTPARFAYKGLTPEPDDDDEGAPTLPSGAPPAKRAKINPGDSSHAEDFETMKLVCRVAVHAAGQNGVTSGALGHKLGSSRQSVTAALYSCVDDGVVENTATEGQPPRWRSVEEPPPHAASLEIPARFGYKGLKGAGGAAPAAPAAGKPALAAVRPVGMVKAVGMVRSSPVVAAAATGRPHIKAEQAEDAGGSNEVGQLTEWASQNRRKLQLLDLGQDMGTGEFFFQAIVDDIPYEGVSAPTKKEAKRLAAGLALEQLGLWGAA
eukprot:TRINITY_DN47130_c0_g1_i1.p1 TRINITY_DN47130_c0_g1~~TRINITY_DN47130_c0_g1_i1.p1  ORF type:complete len:459 (+),score=110.21 TRINITY_DN47130_c0_g1_i1:126-1502(+)